MDAVYLDAVLISCQRQFSLKEKYRCPGPVIRNSCLIVNCSMNDRFTASQSISERKSSVSCYFCAQIQCVGLNLNSSLVLYYFNSLGLQVMHYQWCWLRLTSLLYLNNFIETVPDKLRVSRATSCECQLWKATAAQKGNIEAIVLLSQDG